MRSERGAITFQGNRIWGRDLGHHFREKQKDEKKAVKENKGGIRELEALKGDTMKAEVGCLRKW